MPQIPRYQANAVVKPTKMSPAAAAAPELAMARAGEQIEDTGLYAQRVFSTIREAERKVRAAEIGDLFDSDFKDAALSYATRTDFENFDADANKQIEELRSKYMAMAGEDKTLQEAISVAFNDRAREYYRTIQAKKVQEMGKRAEGNLVESAISLQDLYAQTPDKAERQRLLDEYAAKAHAFAQSGLVTPTQAVNFIETATNEAEVARAMRYIDTAPNEALALLKADEFDLTPKTKQTLIEKTQNKIDMLQREKLTAFDRAERLREKQIKEAREANAVTAWIRLWENDITETEVQDLVRTRRIELEEGKAIIRHLRSPERFENDPIVVGDIAEAIELGQFETASEYLATAIRNGRIKIDKYISYRSALAKEEVSRGMSVLNAIRPGENDTDEGRREKYAQAIDLYLTRVAGDENPLEAARDILSRAQIQNYNDLSGFILPRYLKDNRSDMHSPFPVEDLNQAREATIDAWESGAISEDVCAAELELIERIERINQEFLKFQASQSKLDEEIKRRGAK
jgi:hypothetical protein